MCFSHLEKVFAWESVGMAVVHATAVYPFTLQWLIRMVQWRENKLKPLQSDSTVLFLPHNQSSVPSVRTKCAPKVIEQRGATNSKTGHITLVLLAFLTPMWVDGSCRRRLMRCALATVLLDTVGFDTVDGAVKSWLILKKETLQNPNLKILWLSNHFFPDGNNQYTEICERPRQK